MVEPGTRIYWIITVRDPGDREAGVERYERRFEFGNLEDAFACARSAREAGFTISAAKVVATRAKVSSAIPA
jgi:hypothetical protein